MTDKNRIQENQKRIAAQIEAGHQRAANLNGARHDYFGFDLKTAPDGYPIRPGQVAALCPECEGHGGWYSSPFCGASCGNCNGYGWVSSGQGAHIHEWKEVSQREANEAGNITWGMHCHPYHCEECWEWDIRDSSG